MNSLKNNLVKSEKKIWDLPTRLFHFSLIILIVLQYSSGEFNLLSMRWHFWLGYITLILIIFRILWGFFGSDTARFANFVRGPGSVLSYLRGLFSNTHPLVIGHNPLGGWSVIAMLIVIASQGVSGLFTTDDISEYGPLAELVPSYIVKFMTRLHHLAPTILIGLIILHLLAILFYFFVKKDNLIIPMITGNKQNIIMEKSLRFVGLGWAFFWLIISTGILMLVLMLGEG